MYQNSSLLIVNAHFYHVYSWDSTICIIKPDIRCTSAQLPIMLAPGIPAICTRDAAVDATARSLPDLPPELWIAILRFTDTRTILRCTAVGLLGISRTTRC